MKQIHEIIREEITSCLNKYCEENKIVIREITCRSLTPMKPLLRKGGIYVFVDETTGTIYYVGEAGKLYRRLNEHCRASIGGSEGVVRFLMYMLDKICEDENIRRTRDVKERERAVKHLLREFLGSLTIYVGYCEDDSLNGDEGRLTRRELEECIKRRLKPLLNP